MDIVILLVGLAIVSKLLFRLVRRQRERLEMAWTVAARAVGGKADLPSGFLAGSEAGLRANLEGTEVVAGLGTLGRSPCTWLRAPAPEAGDLRLSIRRGHVSSVGRALGFQDVGVGDPAFDRKFVVTTNNVGLARSWLTPEVRQMVSRVPSYSFSMGDGKVTADGSGKEMDARVLEAAVRAVAALATRGRAGVGQGMEPAIPPAQASIPPGGDDGSLPAPKSADPTARGRER